MKEFIRKGVDLAKNYFQVHALESEDGGAAARKLGRQAVRKFFSETKPCVIGMEACGSAPLSQTKGLGARTHRDGSRGAFDPADLRQALCQAGQERRHRRGGGL
ncbi:MAG: hypothetical protein ACREV8_15485 [Gammaproteobacteria bacterium]